MSSPAANYKYSHQGIVETFVVNQNQSPDNPTTSANTQQAFSIMAQPPRERSIRKRITQSMPEKNMWDKLALNQQEKELLSEFTPHQALEIAIALRKGKIPIHRGVINDLKEFSDEKLSSPLEKL